MTEKLKSTFSWGETHYIALKQEEMSNVSWAALFAVEILIIAYTLRLHWTSRIGFRFQKAAAANWKILFASDSPAKRRF